MFKLKKIVVAIAVCSTLVFTAQGLAKAGHGHNKHAMKKMFSQLSITDTQKQDLKEIFKQSREDKGLLKTDMKAFQQSLNALVQTNDWDQAAVEALLSEKQTQSTGSSLQQAQNKHAIWNILDDEQRAEFTNLMSQKKERAKGKKSDKREKHKQKWESKKAEKLGLDTEQTAHIDSIKAQTKEDMSVLREKLKAFKQAEKALIASETFDASAWQILREEYQADFVAVGLLKEKSRHDVWNILSEEQQTTMQRMNKRSKGGMKHRSTESFF